MYSKVILCCYLHLTCRCHGTYFVIISRVPNNITFGQGVSRGFLGGRGRGRGRHPKRKHWHNMNKSDEKDTTVEIENVDMSELSEALI